MKLLMKSYRDTEMGKEEGLQTLTKEEIRGYSEALDSLENKIHEVRAGIILMEDFVRELSRVHQPELGYAIRMTRYF